MCVWGLFLHALRQRMPFPPQLPVRTTTLASVPPLPHPCVLTPYIVEHLAPDEWFTRNASVIFVTQIHAHNPPAS
ncbi:hypothetical protein AB205_0046530 [Aquarana catesbeiana]|uniref:Uncharacterized protein n=1 Tax=Aquarana catesbeiana TaxID=8400 RepID=A0A2G9RML1_AQUCT|nr:hypothetical protein AB205_0046530 [Aquarana catesbeiana]